MNFRNVSTEDEEKYEVDTSAIDEVLEKYKILDHNIESSDLIKLDLPVLTPNQINLFFQTMDYNNDSRQIWVFSSSLFLTELIHNSWRFGYNDFMIQNLEYDKISFLFYDLKGEKDNPISITFNGKSGSCFAERSKDCIFNINGELDRRFGNNSDNCIYNISVKDNLNLEIQNCFSNSFNILKKVNNIGNQIGDEKYKIKRSVFNLYEGVDEIKWDSISDCIFRVPDLKIYENLLSSFRKFKSEHNSSDSRSEWSEKIINSFKEDSNLLEETFFYEHKKRNVRLTKYNKIQLIK